MTNYVCYDIEVTLGMFCIVLKDYESKKVVTYRISAYKNDYQQLKKHWNSLVSRGFYFIGFNNIGFDAQVMEFLLKKERTPAEIYRESQRIINLDEFSRWQNTIPEWKLTSNQIDLYTIKGFNSLVKATSLKFLEFNFRMSNIEEMPLPHNILYTEEEENLTEEYCKYDVEATELAFEKFKSEVIARMEASKEFGINLNNAAEPKMVKKIFTSELTRELGITRDELIERRNEYKAQIKPFKVSLPSYLKFNDPILQKVFNFYEQLIIDPFKTKSAVDLNYRYHGIEIFQGLGGTHASVKPSVLSSCNKWIIEDIDYTSFYPFIKIRNDLFPTYLSKKYLEIYEGFYAKRLTTKKGTPLNYCYKILLNSAYGLLNEENSPIYHVESAISVTIIGQLTLLMLTEKLVETCNELILIQLNTDGITMKYPVEYKEAIKECYESFSKMVNIGIESIFYDKMVINNVNNYISVDIEGNSKRKGLFEIYKDLNKTGMWNKNTSFNIIPLALNAYFIEGKDFREFIKKHEDIYDFCGVVKKKSNFDIAHYDKLGNRTAEGKITRYFISKDGNYLIKEYHDGRSSKVEAGWKTTVLNHIKEGEKHKIDYNYYIKAVEKIIFEIEGNLQQTTLF